jgi:6-phosphogluconolactonase
MDEISSLLDQIDKIKKENEALEKELKSGSHDDNDILVVGSADYDVDFEKGSQIIMSYKLDKANGKLELLSTTEAGANPTFLAFSPCGNYVYATDERESFEGNLSGAVSALAVDKHTGKLTLLNRKASTGRYPCHVSVSSNGRVLLVANYGEGSVGVLPIEADGTLVCAEF